MRDRRSVDDLSIEELERILAIKKRQSREERLRRFNQTGKRSGDVLPANDQQGLKPVPRAEAEAEPDPVKKTARDRLLLGLEVAAVIGLVALLVGTAFSLRNLNQEAASVQELTPLPSPSATPLINSVVLPGGHTPPTGPGGAQPNLAEVPEHLRPVVQQSFFGLTVLPTPGPNNGIRITIPAIGVDAPIVEGDTWEQLKKGVAHRLGTANPGQTGNMVFSAHNDIFGEIFRDLDQLQPGDEIYIQTASRSYTYIVREQLIVAPTEVSLMDPTHEPTTTLISCYPYLIDTERIVIIGELVE